MTLENILKYIDNLNEEDNNELLQLHNFVQKLINIRDELLICNNINLGKWKIKDFYGDERGSATAYIIDDNNDIVCSKNIRWDYFECKASNEEELCILKLISMLPDIINIMSDCLKENSNEIIN